MRDKKDILIELACQSWKDGKAGKKFNLDLIQKTLTELDNLELTEEEIYRLLIVGAIVNGKENAKAIVMGITHSIITARDRKREGK